MNPLSPGTALFLVLFLAFVHTAFARAKLHIIRPMRGTHFTLPADISADGRVIATFSERTNFLAQGGRQVRGSRGRFISLHRSFESAATSVSADGSVVVGWSYNAASQTRAFRWTKQTGAVDLSSNPDLNYVAYGVSGDGQTVVGSYLYARDQYHPFFWSPGYHFQPLPLGGHDEGYAYSASHDGTVVVGFVGTTNAIRTQYACRWVNKHEPELLDPLVPGSFASAVTPDGSVIVGGASTASGGRAFYWVRWSGMQWIEPPENQRYIGFGDISADGRRIVGSMQALQAFDFVNSAILWTGDEGVQDLNELYPSLLPRSWRFAEALGISADGRWIAGSLSDGNDHYRGYILDTGRRR